MKVLTRGDLLPRARVVLAHMLEMEASSQLADFGALER